MKNDKFPFLHIQPLNKVKQIGPDEKLGPALAKTQTSHDAVFVFEKGSFKGIVSPYLSLFKKRYPHVSKVSHCLFKPPKINSSTPIYDIAEYMLFSKIYTLPVYGNTKHVIGAITADNIIRTLIENNKLLKIIIPMIIINKPIITNIHSTVKEVYKLMRENKIARIVLVNDEGKLAGIAARKDIEDAFIAKTVRERHVTKVTTNKIEPVRSSFDEEEITRRDAPILEFTKTRVVSAPLSFNIESIIRKMFYSGQHSIVIIDKQRPVGFLSRHDVLKAITSLKPEKEIALVVEKPLAGWREYALRNAYEFLDTFAKKVHKRFPIQRIELHINQPKNAAGLEKNLFSIKLHVLLKSGKLLLASVETRKIEIGMSDVLDKIENQIDLSDRQKHTHLI